MGEALPYTQQEIEKIVDRGVFKGFLRFDDIEVVLVLEVGDKTYEMGFWAQADLDGDPVLEAWLRERK